MRPALYQLSYAPKKERIAGLEPAIFGVAIRRLKPTGPYPRKTGVVGFEPTMSASETDDLATCQHP